MKEGFNVPLLVSRGMNAELTKEVTEAVFQIRMYKAPGPDGFSGVFFQKYWNIVKGEVIEDVRSFFRTTHLLKELNRTDIVLIPKVKVPETIA